VDANENVDDGASAELLDGGGAAAEGDDGASSGSSAVEGTPPVFAAAAEAAADIDRRRPKALFVRLSAVLPWALLAAAIGAAFLSAESAARRVLYFGAVSGLVGFWTNWLAVRLLFKPTRPRFGFGVIPANRDALIARLSGAIESRLVNADALAEWLHERGVVRDTLRRWHGAASRVLGSTEFREDLRARLSATGALYLDDETFRKAATEKLSAAVGDLLRKKVWSWVADLVEAPVLERVKAEFLKGLRAHGGAMLDNALAKLDDALDALVVRMEEALPEIEQAASERIVEGLRKLDVRGLVEARLRDLDDGELEELIRNAVRNELAAVEVLGGALGVVAGILAAPLL
jgi:uncharacterized membrane protein YheB (UPF0754 family)